MTELSHRPSVIKFRILVSITLALSCPLATKWNKSYLFSTFLFLPTIYLPQALFFILVAKLKSSFLQFIVYSLEWSVLAFPRVALTESRRRDERELHAEAAQDANISQALETISVSLESWPCELRTTALIIVRGPLFIINRLPVRGDRSGIYDYKSLPGIQSLTLTQAARRCVGRGLGRAG